MRTRFMRLGSLLAALTLAITACGGTQSSASSPPGESAAASGTPASQAPAAKVKLRLASWVGEDEGKELQQLVIDKVNASQSEYEIVSEPTPAEYYTKLQTGLSAGAGADLIWLSQEYVAGYASRGALLDITDALTKIDAPAAKVDGYFPNIMKTAIYQDKVYGLPWIAQPVLLFYNPKLFDVAGIPYPDATWDWAKFMQVAETLTKDTDGDGKIDQWGYTATSASWGVWPPKEIFIWQNGGQVITDDRTSSPVDSPEAIAGVEQYAKIVFNPKCCPSEATITEQGFDAQFKTGKIAMFTGGAADTYGELPVVGASVLPHAKNGATFSWTASTVVNAKTANPEIAVRALVALTDAIQHWKIVAPRPDLVNTETILASIPDQWKAQKEGQIPAMIEATKTMSALNIVPRQAEWETLIQTEYLDPLFHGKGTAADLAAAVRPKLEALLK